MSPLHAGIVLWFWFAVSWAAAMLWTGRAASRGAIWPSIAYFAGFAIGFALLFSTPAARIALRIDLIAGVPPRLWRDPPVVGWALLLAELAGLGLAWWARLHLGRLWSSMMTLREGHRVVDSGPYRLVRHPIYTGLIAAAWALALLATTAAALTGAIVLTLVMAVKARREERLLRRALGLAYDAYAARTPMIVPFWR